MEQLALFDLSPCPPLPSPRRRPLLRAEPPVSSGVPLTLFAGRLPAPSVPSSVPPRESLLPEPVPAPVAQGRKFTAFGLTLSIREWCLETSYAAVDPPTLSRRVKEYPLVPFERLLTTPTEIYTPDEQAEKRFLAVPSTLWSRVKRAAKKHRFHVQEFIKEGLDVALLCGEPLPFLPLPLHDPPQTVSVWVGQRSAVALARSSQAEGLAEDTCILLILAELAAFGD